VIPRDQQLSSGEFALDDRTNARAQFVSEEHPEAEPGLDAEREDTLRSRQSRENYVNVYF
jgi:hypothetical protein